jgi:hypothetical protein
MSEFSAYNAAIVLMGTLQETYSQAATAVVGEPLTTSAVKGAYYKFAKLGPHTSITIKQAAATLVLNTDYEVTDPDLGIIHLLESSVTVTNGSTITADYTPTAYAAGAVPEVLAGESSTVEGSFLFVGDPSTGPRMMVEVWKVSFTPDGAFGLISDEFADVGMQGSVLADPTNHPTNKLYKVTYLPF